MANQPLNEEQLQALLRIKRHEQPPPGYFDDLLRSVQRRQREEMLRRPAWKLMAERISTFFASFRQDWAYATSMAAVLVIGIGAIQLAIPRKQQAVATDRGVTSTSIADNGGGKPTFLGTPVRLRLDGSQRGSNMHEVKTLRPGPPRFIIDSTPESYERNQIQF